MRTDHLLTKEYLNYLFEYREGNIFWRVKRSHHTVMGKATGSIMGKYIGTRVDGVLYRNHVLIWIMNNGSIPDGKKISHRNRIKTDNRVENLRLK